MKVSMCGIPYQIIKCDDNFDTVNTDMRADFLKRQYEAVLEEIKRLKADRPQGGWKRMKFTDCGSPVHKCSICGHYINGDVEVRNFCPNCGARMKGAEDE